MSTRQFCREEIIFRRIDGRNRPIHSNGVGNAVGRQKLNPPTKRPNSTDQKKLPIQNLPYPPIARYAKKMSTLFDTMAALFGSTRPSGGRGPNTLVSMIPMNQVDRSHCGLTIPIILP